MWTWLSNEPTFVYFLPEGVCHRDIFELILLFQGAILTTVGENLVVLSVSHAAPARSREMIVPSSGLSMKCTKYKKPEIWWCN